MPMVKGGAYCTLKSMGCTWLISNLKKRFCKIALNHKIKLLKHVCDIRYLVILNNNLLCCVYSINYGLEVEVPIILVLINIFSESTLQILISCLILQHRKELPHALQ